MHKKFEINQTKIKGGCQLGRKVVTHNSKSDLPLAICYKLFNLKEGQNNWFFVLNPNDFNEFVVVHVDVSKIAYSLKNSATM